MHVAVWGSIPKKNQESHNPVGSFWVFNLNLSLMILYFVVFILSFMWSFLCGLWLCHICSVSLFAVFFLDICIFIYTYYNSWSICTLYSFLKWRGWGGGSLFLFLIGLDPVKESLLFPICFPNSNKHIQIFPLTYISHFLPPKKQALWLLFAVTLIEWCWLFQLLWLSYYYQSSHHTHSL